MIFSCTVRQEAKLSLG